MRTLWRTAGRRLVRDILALSVAAAFIGLSYGAIAVASGVPAWAVISMSLLVFAGGSQFLAVALLAAGSPVAAVLGGLLLNARHLPFGLAVADVLAGSRPQRLIGAHLMIDESVAFAMAQGDAARRRAAYWLTGITLFVLWQTGTVLGVAIGSAVGDPAQYGLDAAFPAALLALILPSLRDAVGLRVAVLGSAIAVATTFFLPAGLPILLSLLGLAAAWRRSRAEARA